MVYAIPLFLEEPMDTQTFLNNLKEAADRYQKSPKNSKEFFDYFDTHFTEYIHATPDERAEIRKFIRGRLFQSNHIAHTLLLYVKQRVLANLASTTDDSWVRRGLVAISMDNFSGKFDDPVYVAYPMKGDCTFLLADLYVTAEEKGIDPKPIFEEIASISDDKDTSSYDSMKGFMARGGDGKLVHERRTHGKFVGMF
jgi:hypothetical protein